jgi:hypothetical protein
MATTMTWAVVVVLASAVLYLLAGYRDAEVALGSHRDDLCDAKYNINRLYRKLGDVAKRLGEHEDAGMSEVKVNLCNQPLDSYCKYPVFEYVCASTIESHKDARKRYIDLVKALEQVESLLSPSQRKKLAEMRAIGPELAKVEAYRKQNKS